LLEFFPLLGSRFLKTLRVLIFGSSGKVKSSKSLSVEVTLLRKSLFSPLSRFILVFFGGIVLKNVVTACGSSRRERRNPFKPRQSDCTFGTPYDSLLESYA
jgi:hypothetical protein